MRLYIKSISLIYEEIMNKIRATNEGINNYRLLVILGTIISSVIGVLLRKYKIETGNFERRCLLCEDLN